MNKVIRVYKISNDSYNRLIKLGYTVILTSFDTKPSPYAKYVYEKTSKVKSLIKPTKTYTPTHACTMNHVIAEPKKSYKFLGIEVKGILTRWLKIWLV